MVARDKREVDRLHTIHALEKASGWTRSVSEGFEWSSAGMFLSLNTAQVGLTTLRFT